MKKDIFSIIFWVVASICVIYYILSVFKLPGEVTREFMQEQEKLIQQQRLNNGTK